MKPIKILCLAVLALTTFTHCYTQKLYYRVGSSFPELKLDRVPLAKATLTLDFEATDSIGVVGKKFYKRNTRDGNVVYKANDRSYFSFLSTDDLTGFVVTSPSVDGVVSWSLYLRYKKDKKANQAPDPVPGTEAFDMLADLASKIIDPRTRTYFTVFNDLAKTPGGGRWGDPVTTTQDFIMISPDTIEYNKWWYIRKADNYFEHDQYGGDVIYTLPNGMIIVRHIFMANGQVSAAYTPTKEMADQLLSQDYTTKTDLAPLDAKAKEFRENRSAMIQNEKDASFKDAVTKFVSTLRSARSEPVLEQALRKRLISAQTPTISLKHIYFLDDAWQIIRDNYDQIVWKKLAGVFLFKDSKDGSCYMKFWNVQYSYMGNGTYGTELELGTTYPSKLNTSRQNSYLSIEVANGATDNLYAGNSYDFDCKILK
jgi:hypothetical protein